MLVIEGIVRLEVFDLRKVRVSLRVFPTEANKLNLRAKTHLYIFQNREMEQYVRQCRDSETA
jgi:hypothetical protein